MKDGWEEPHKTVCDNIQIAETFIRWAEQREIAPAVPQRWCLIIAASALWSAVEIFNKKVASQVEEKLTSKKGKGVSAQTKDWFQEHEPLVDTIRNGMVHAARPQTGVGQTIGPDTEVSIHVWVKTDDGDYQEIPIAEALSRLNKVADQIRDHAFGLAKTWYISLG
jgi:hypothetical protein